MPQHQMIDIPEVDFMAVEENVTDWRIGKRIVIDRPKVLYGWGCSLVLIVPLIAWLAYGLFNKPLDESFSTIVWSCAILGGLYFYYKSPFNRDNRGRETTIDWEQQTLTIRDGFRTQVYALNDIRRICLQTTATSGQPPEYRGIVEIDAGGTQCQLFKTLSSHAEKDQPCHLLLAVARRLAREFSVACEVYCLGIKVEEKGLIGRGLTDSEVAKKYATLGSIASGYAMSADFHGNAKEAEERRQEAVYYHMQASKLDPTLTDSLLSIGRLTKNEDQREMFIEAALQRNPDDVSAIIELARKHSLEGREEEALAVFTQAVEKEPSVTTYEARGGAYQDLEQFELAYADFSEAIKLESQEAECYGNRADCLKEWYEKSSKSDLIDQALADYAEAIRLDPQDSTYRTERGILLKLAGRFEAAIDELTRAVNSSADPFYALSQRGQAYLDSGNAAKKAEQDFSRIIDLLEQQPQTTDPTMSYFQTTSIATAYRWRAEARRQLGWLEQADDDEQRACTIAETAEATM